MTIQLIGDGIEIDERIKQIVEEKLNKEIGKYLHDFAADLQMATVRIEHKTRNLFKVNFDMRLPGATGHIYGEEEGDELLNVIIALRHEIERQVREYKDRLQDPRQ
ncbi:ribosome-associated translation inhibitor RaiA [Candidatus Woesebacteria bacterium]|jgi:ribosomal subunit interface protein|nr:ribosome-associated translation inhibitor RaiA [Candidatus Woesebacteria bacterium]MBP9687198.1 ribosome-associated translation inhibitor RaiA [Candidatus Woesebacteria bacterium]